MENTKTSKVYAIPDSGIFLVDFYSPLAEAQIIKLAAKTLMNMVNQGRDAFPIKECF